MCGQLIAFHAFFTGIFLLVRHSLKCFLFYRIKHYGRTVTYDSRDFVSRNRDALDRELSQAMYECDHPILKVLFPEGKETILKEKKKIRLDCYV